jgi:hypothetical protein
MARGWPGVSYGQWGETCDTLHAHAQVLGKLAVELAPPEPELQHGALRLSARGLETAPLPAPDGSGSLVAALDLRVHEAVVEHDGGAVKRVPLTPDRPVAQVTREVLAAVADLAGGCGSTRRRKRCRGACRSTETTAMRTTTPTRFGTTSRRPPRRHWR